MTYVMIMCVNQMLCSSSSDGYSSMASQILDAHASVKVHVLARSL